ncbi:hypothetical protein WJX79_004320 [Trebouxia sp. C0005]
MEAICVLRTTNKGECPILKATHTSGGKAALQPRLTGISHEALGSMYWAEGEQAFRHKHIAVSCLTSHLAGSCLVPVILRTILDLTNSQRMQTHQPQLLC